MATKPVFDDVAPWPEKPAPAVAAIGHNLPPIEERIPAEFREALIEEQADFYQKLDDLLGVGNRNAEDYKTGAVDRAKCTNDDELARCGILVNSLRKAKQRVEKVHKTQKQPHLDAGRLVDQQKNGLTARLDSAAEHVETLQRDYQREQRRLAEVERLRLLDEQREAEQKRAELEALAEENGLEDVLPPAPEPLVFPDLPVRSAPIRTDGATVSTGLEWVLDSVDVVKAIKHCKSNTAVIDAVTKAMKALVKSTSNNAGKGYAGVIARQDVKVSNR